MAKSERIFFIDVACVCKSPGRLFVLIVISFADSTSNSYCSYSRRTAWMYWPIESSSYVSCWARFQFAKFAHSHTHIDNIYCERNVKNSIGHFGAMMCSSHWLRSCSLSLCAVNWSTTVYGCEVFSSVHYRVQRAEREKERSMPTLYSGHIFIQKCVDVPLNFILYMCVCVCVYYSYNSICTANNSHSNNIYGNGSGSDIDSGICLKISFNMQEAIRTHERDDWNDWRRRAKETHDKFHRDNPYQMGGQKEWNEWLNASTHTHTHVLCR